MNKSEVVTPDPRMIEAFRSIEFPVLELAKLANALAAEFATLTHSQRLVRARYFIDAFASIKNLAEAYSNIEQSRTGQMTRHAGHVVESVQRGLRSQGRI